MIFSVNFKNKIKTIVKVETNFFNSVVDFSPGCHYLSCYIFRNISQPKRKIFTFNNIRVADSDPTISLIR